MSTSLGTGAIAFPPTHHFLRRREDGTLELLLAEADEEAAA